MSNQKTTVNKEISSYSLTQSPQQLTDDENSDYLGLRKTVLPHHKQDND